jgi:hypothetical protein
MDSDEDMMTAADGPPIGPARARARLSTEKGAQ